MKKSSIILLAILFFSFAKNANAVDLLRYWEFNDIGDPATALDTVAGEPGILEGGAAYTADAGGRTGVAGDYGMDFGVDSSGQTVRVPDASFLNAGTDTVTYSFWQKLENVANSSTFWAISPSSSGNARGAQAHVTWGDGTLYFDTAGCCDGATQRISGPPPAEHDFLQWHHYVFVKNGAAKEIWIDGALALSGTSTAPLPTDFSELYLGSEGGSGNNSLQGRIDDFAIFDDALTSGLIGRLAAGESALTVPEPSGLSLLLLGFCGFVLRRRGK